MLDEAIREASEDVAPGAADDDEGRRDESAASGSGWDRTAATEAIAKAAERTAEDGAEGPIGGGGGSTSAEEADFFLVATGEAAAAMVAA